MHLNQCRQPVRLACAGASAAGQSPKPAPRRSPRKPRQLHPAARLLAQQQMGSAAVHHSAIPGQPSSSQHLQSNSQAAQLSHPLHQIAEQNKGGNRSPVLPTFSRLCAETSVPEEIASGDIMRWMQKMEAMAQRTETAIDQQVSNVKTKTAGLYKICHHAFSMI